MTGWSGVRLRPTRDRLIVGAAMLVLLILSVHQIKAKAFWYDEAVSLANVRLPFDRFVANIAGDEVNGALYWILLAFWRLLGEGEARVRFLSVLCVVATVPLLYVIGRRHVGSAGALAGCVLFAVDPFVIEYAQEARMYALAMLVSSAAVLSWSFATETDRRRWWVAYAVLATASLYTHFFCGFVVLGMGITWLLGLVPRTRRSVIAQAAIVLAGVPLALFVLGTGAGRLSWIEPLGETGVSAVLGKFGAGQVALAALLYGCAIAAIPARGAAQVERVAPVVAWWLTPLVAGLMLSMSTSLLVPRYFIVSLPPMMLLAGAGAVRIGGLLGRRRWGLPIATAIVSVAILLGLGPLGDWYGQTRTGWRDAAAWVSRTAQPGDRIAYHLERGQIPFANYLRRHDRAWPREASLEDLRMAPGRSWIVLYAIGNQQYDALRDSLPGYRVVASKKFEDIRVQLLERP